MANGTNWSSRKNAYYVQWRQNRKQQNQQNQQPPQPQQANVGGAGGGGPINPPPSGSSTAGGYTNNNNPALLKYQQQEPDKMASFLSSVSNNTDLSQYPDRSPWNSYHDNPYQKLMLRLGLNDKPQVMSASDFDNYVRQNNLEVIVRGWQSQSSMDRFTQADNSHPGCGRYGDGFYFGSQSTANKYNSYYQTQAALSPNAKVIGINELRAQMPSRATKIGKALYKAGTTGERNYYDPNIGESQWALHLGYNVIDAGWCKVILTRDAVVVRG